MLNLSIPWLLVKVVGRLMFGLFLYRQFQHDDRFDCLALGYDVVTIFSRVTKFYEKLLKPQSLSH